MLFIFYIILYECSTKYTLIQEKTIQLRNELLQSQEAISQQKQETEKLRQDITALEFQKYKL